MALYQGLANWHDHCFIYIKPTEKWLREDALTSIVDLPARSLGVAYAFDGVVVRAGADRNASRVGIFLRLSAKMQNAFGAQPLSSGRDWVIRILKAEIRAVPDHASVRRRAA